MGRRKSRKVAPKKKRVKLPREFGCPFCNHEKCISVILDKKNMIGQLNCRTCNASYCCKISMLWEPIDVFGSWLDRCEQANNPSAQQHKSSEIRSEDGLPDAHRNESMKRKRTADTPDEYDYASEEEELQTPATKTKRHRPVEQTYDTDDDEEN